MEAIDGLMGVFPDKVGKLAVENDFLSQGLKRCPIERKAMTRKDHAALSLTK